MLRVHNSIKFHTTSQLCWGENIGAVSCESMSSWWRAYVGGGGDVGGGGGGDVGRGGDVVRRQTNKNKNVLDRDGAPSRS